MIIYETHKILLPITDKFAVFSWELMLAAAWFFAGYFIYKEAKKSRDISMNYAMQFLLMIFLGVMFGARLFHFFGPWGSGSFYERLIAIFSARGGWVGFGGIIGAIILCLIYCRIRKISFPKYADIIAPAVALGIFIVRIGCFIAGCCFGTETNALWAIIRNGTAIHPTQLYASLISLGIFAVLIHMREKKKEENRFDGYLFYSLLIMYSAGRFITEFFRGDYPLSNYFYSLTSSQLICIAFILIFALLLITKLKREKLKKKKAEKIKTRYYVKPKTYCMIICGGITANIGAYLVTPLPYMAITLIIFGLFSVLKGINSIFKKT